MQRPETVFFQMAWTALVGHEINLMCLEQHLKINRIDVRLQLI